jgi:acetylornithine deacetylase
MNLVLAHKGFIWARVRTVGRAAHGSRFDEGLDAIVMAGKYLVEFDAYERELLRRPPHPLVGPPSAHASLIQGGQELSSYPAECAIEIERRTIPGEMTNAVAAELQSLADQAAAADKRFQAEVATYFERPPSETPADAPIARALAGVMQQHLAHAPEPRGATFWMDMALLIQAGIPTVALGPGGAGAHAAVEYVFMDDVVRCAEIYADLAREWCG